MKKLIVGAVLIGAVLAPTDPGVAYAGTGSGHEISVKLHKSGKVKFSKKTVKKLKSKKQKKIIAKRVKRGGLTRAFERDIRGCELQFKVRTVGLSDCLNQTIRAHGMYK